MASSATSTALSKPLTPSSASSGSKKLRRSRRPIPHAHPKIATVFEWTEGGSVVYLLGSFSEKPWIERHAMERVEENSRVVFRCTLELPIGIHSYKFIVDGQWRYAIDQPTLSDPDGNINNVIAVRMATENRTCQRMQSSNQA